MSADVMPVAAEAMPYVSAAVGAYGGAVLARVRDETADATVNLGRRLLARVFGVRKPGEPLPGPLADLAADPGDRDAVVAVRLAVCQALAADPVMAGEVRLMLAGASQRVRAGRDAYTAAGSQTIINQYGAGTPPPSVPGLLLRVQGDIPARNPGFTGRDGLLKSVRAVLLGGDRAAVQVLHGMSGVGKTQLAVEYAHRYADGYDLVWWIEAGQAELIGTQVAALADALGCPQPGGGPAELRRAVFRELRARRHWLLVFDNAEDPEHLAAWLPGGDGHVLITSRARRWADIAALTEINVMARSESVALLTARIPALSAADADRIAEAVGDLPLAVAQAAGYMADTGMPAPEYAGLLATRAAEILDEGRPVSYPRSLAAVTRLALDRLRAGDPAAAELAVLCAALAPAPIPAEWFPRAAAALPELLQRQVADPLTWRATLAMLGQHALARVDSNALQMHQLTKAIIHGQQPPAQQAASRTTAEAVVAASHPGNGQNPSSWPGWARLLPHLLILDPASTSNTDLRILACDAAWYLRKRGDARASHNLADLLYQRWRNQPGPDDPQTLHAGYVLASALSGLGNNIESRNLDEDILARRRRVLGENHIDTLRAAIALAVRYRYLGDAQTALSLDEDTLARCRQALGTDHPLTLGCANNLALDLSRTGHPQAARELEEDTLTRRRRVLGENHPDTLLSARSLALAMRAAGDLDAARNLDEDTLTRCREVLGADHPDTLASALALAADFRALGHTQAARDLDEDTLTRSQQVLGEDHPGTRSAANRLAPDIHDPENS